MTKSNMTDTKKQSVATKVVSDLTKGEETSTSKLLSLIPEGHSPKVYVDLVKSQVLGVDKDKKDRSDEDLMLFLYTAKRTGLDPLVKQIYAVYRWDSRLGREKMTIQSGIDGFRLVAQRQGGYAGQDEATYIPVDESTKYPVKASVTVYKIVQGSRVAFTASARWSEYVQFDKNGKPQGLWEKMPYLMLAKCAESLALRKAFPNELSGIYSDVEMNQSSNLLGDLPTPDKFKKETGEIKVEFGAPDEGRPEIKQNPEAVTDSGKGQEKAKEEVNNEAVGSPEAAVVTEEAKPGKPELGVAPQIMTGSAGNPKLAVGVAGAAPDLASMRSKIETMKEREKERSQNEK